MSQSLLPQGLTELLNDLEDFAPAVSCCRPMPAPQTLSSDTRTSSLSLVHPQIPDQVTQYVLRQSGDECKDVRT